MGIDKPDIHFVIHAAPADSIDSYYQEIGRAGRDGDPALAVLVYRQEDLGLAVLRGGRTGRGGAAGSPGSSPRRRRRHRGRRRRHGPPRGDRPRGHPLARDLNLLEQVAAVVLDEDGAARPADDAPPPAEAAAAARELAEHHERVDLTPVEMMRGYAET